MRNGNESAATHRRSAGCEGHGVCHWLLRLCGGQAQGERRVAGCRALGMAVGGRPSVTCLANNIQRAPGACRPRPPGCVVGGACGDVVSVQHDRMAAWQLERRGAGERGGEARLPNCPWPGDANGDEQTPPPTPTTSLMMVRTAAIAWSACPRPTTPPPDPIPACLRCGRRRGTPLTGSSTSS